MNFTAIDFETATSKYTSICSIGICVVKDNEIVERKGMLIRPKTLEFNDYNIKIHGITPEMVEDDRRLKHLEKVADLINASKFPVVYFGGGVPQDNPAHPYTARVAKLGDDIEISIVNGGQPIYYFIISVE